MKYEVVLPTDAHVYTDVECIFMNDADYIIYGENDKVLGVYPRKEVCYIRNVD